MAIPFTSLRNYPFCPTAAPETDFTDWGIPPFPITDSSLDAAESMRFYWLLESLTITVERSSVGSPIIPATGLRTTEINFRKNSISGISEPYQRTCEQTIYGAGSGRHLTLLSEEHTKLHIEVPLYGGQIVVITDSIAYLALTTVNADWGFTYPEEPFMYYADTTIPIDVDGLTLYVKCIADENASTLDSATVDDFSFFSI